MSISAPAVMIRTLALGLGLLVTGALTAPADAAGDEVHVVLDQAKVMRIDKPADTVIVGNPAVADAIMHDSRTLVLIGRGFGSTNIIILDDKGAPIADEMVVVEPPSVALVTVQRGKTRFSYSCAPNCSPTVNPGDNAEFFSGTIEQFGTRNGAAQQAATGKGN